VREGVGNPTTSREEQGHLRFVRKIAETIKRQVNPPMELDELVSLGFVGLQEALGRYDQEANVKFETFAFYRIRGAIYEGIAKQCHLSRHMARKFRLAQKANDYMEGASADIGARDMKSAAAGAALVAGILRDLTSIHGLVSARFRPSDDREWSEVEFIDETAAGKHEKAVESSEIRELLKELPSEQSQLLQMYYYEDMTLEAAGKKLGFTKSWACKLHNAAIKQLRKLMEEKGMAP
jgi:RNA polymerase sigma factor for flagellar operon FliA